MWPDQQQLCLSGSDRCETSAPLPPWLPCGLDDHCTPYDASFNVPQTRQKAMAAVLSSHPIRHPCAKQPSTHEEPSELPSIHVCLDGSLTSLQLLGTSPNQSKAVGDSQDTIPILVDMCAHVCVCVPIDNISDSLVGQRDFGKQVILTVAQERPHMRPNCLQGINRCPLARMKAAAPPSRLIKECFVLRFVKAPCKWGRQAG